MEPRAMRGTYTYVVVVISPATMQVPVVTRTSSARTASRTASEIWSAILSGWPSVTDSDVKRCLCVSAKFVLLRALFFTVTRDTQRSSLVTVMIRLVWPFHGNAQVFGLFGGQGAELHADFLQVQPRHFFVQLLGQRVNARPVAVAVPPEVELGQR